MSKNKVDSKKLMSVLNTKDGNFKQLLVKLINNMIKKSYNQFKKKSIKGGEGLYSIINNTKVYDDGDKFKFNNNDTYNTYDNVYKFDTIIRTPEDEISSLELHNTNKFYTPYMQQDINRSYNFQEPYMSVR